MRLEEILACPVDRSVLSIRDDEAVCVAGHRFPCAGGISVLLTDEPGATHPVFAKSLTDARSGSIHDLELGPDEIDPVVQGAIGATNGYLYEHLIGRLPRYPIPDLRLPPGDGRLFLEVGCSWGRWCLAAARAGYEPVGIDPSLEAILAARRIARQLGLAGHFVVGDARALPFREGVFDAAFSYSVFQHFSKENTRAALAEIRRVLRPQGTSFVQMANTFGGRALFQQARDRLRPTGDREFRVRYWTPAELRRTFACEIGPSEVETDGFFSLNAQAADADLMPVHLRAAIRASDALRAASAVLTPLTWVADSLYVRSTST